MGGGPRVVVSSAAFHARVRGSFPGRGGLKETKMFLPYPLEKLSILGSPRDREVVCSASDRQDSNFESCVWRAMSSHSSHHPQRVLLAQFSLCVHKNGLKPDSFHFGDRVNMLMLNVVNVDLIVAQCRPTSQQQFKFSHLIFSEKPEVNLIIYLHKMADSLGPMSRFLYTSCRTLSTCQETGSRAYS